MASSSFILQRAATLGAPLAAIAYGCVQQGILFSSLVPVGIVVVFAIIQAGLQYVLFEAMFDYFAAVGKQVQYWSALGIIYGLCGLGCVQLYLLMTR